jgi:hypothetical protein
MCDHHGLCVSRRVQFRAGEARDNQTNRTRNEKSSRPELRQYILPFIHLSKLIRREKIDRRKMDDDGNINLDDVSKVRIQFSVPANCYYNEQSDSFLYAV